MDAEWPQYYPLASMSIADRIAASAGIMLRAMGQAGQALGQSAPGQPLGGGSLTGGSLPDLGIHGDLVAAAEMFRRVREQDDINQGGWSGSGGMFGMYPWISEYRAGHHSAYLWPEADLRCSHADATQAVQR